MGRKMQTLSRQNGMAIVENMIAILIFAFGILGIVGLQAASVKNTVGAKHRNDAGMLANRIVGQMWTGDRSNAALKADFGSPGGQKYVEWKTAVANVLPGAADNPPSVVIDDNNVATVTVRWRAPGETAAHNYVLVARITG